MNEELRKKYAEMQMINMQLQDFQQRSQILEQQISDLEVAQLSLQDLNACKEAESFSTISPGVLVKSNISDTSNVVVNVGAGIFVEKPVEQTIHEIADQVSELRTFQNEIEGQVQGLMAKARQIEEDAEKLIE